MGRAKRIYLGIVATCHWPVKGTTDPLKTHFYRLLVSVLYSRLCSTLIHYIAQFPGLSILVCSILYCASHQHNVSLVHTCLPPHVDGLCPQLCWVTPKLNWSNTIIAGKYIHLHTCVGWHDVPRMWEMMFEFVIYQDIICIDITGRYAVGLIVHSIMDL